MVLLLTWKVPFHVPQFHASRTQNPNMRLRSRTSATSKEDRNVDQSLSEAAINFGKLGSNQMSLARYISLFGHVSLANLPCLQP